MQTVPGNSFPPMFVDIDVAVNSIGFWMGSKLYLNHYEKLVERDDSHHIYASFYLIVLSYV